MKLKKMRPPETATIRAITKIIATNPHTPDKKRNVAMDLYFSLLLFKSDNHREIIIHLPSPMTYSNLMTENHPTS